MWWNALWFILIVLWIFLAIHYFRSYRKWRQQDILRRAERYGETFMMDPTDVEVRLTRLELAVGTMAQWLVQAQTGFGAHDAEGIERILRGEKDDANKKS